MVQAVIAMLNNVLIRLNDNRDFKVSDALFLQANVSAEDVEQSFSW